MMIEPFLIFLSTMISLNTSSQANPAPKTDTTHQQSVQPTTQQPIILSGGWDRN